MNLKKLWALLLTLAMVFSLAACAGGDKDDSAKKDDEQTEETAEQESPAAKLDYTVLVDEYEAFLSNPSLKGFAALAGGTLVGDEMQEYLAFSLQTMGMTEDDFIEATSDSLTNVKVVDSSAEALSADEIAEYQDQLADVVAEYQSMISEIESSTEEDWAEFAEELGVTVDEAKEIGADLVDTLTAMVEALDGVEIEEAQRVTINIEQDGEATEQEFYFFTSGGKWFSDGVFSM